MRKNKAIEILNTQITKFDNINIYKDESWIYQTTSYIKDFFGVNSVEYKFITEFTFDFKYNITDSEIEINLKRNAKKENMRQFLENCIETLSIKGIYKEPNKNIVSDKSNYELILIIIAVSIFFFWLGHWARSVELFKFEKEKTEEDIAMIFCQQNPINIPK